ncbi:MAG: inositol monophosphatase family protein [Gammaproteobacteria bacterium]|nr:inositol monophosphatase family protein [Gammaproteobacteria bacterium]
MEQTTISELERRLVEAAEAELLTRFNRVEAEVKADGSLLTEADSAMQARLQRELDELFPEHAMLGEEMDAEEQHRLLAGAGQGLWVLDPLDGTSNFASGIPYFCVSLALLVRGEVQLALVYDPVRRELFHARAGAGAWLNRVPLGRRRPLTPLRQGIGLVDYKRLPGELVQRLATAAPYSSQRSFGSVALDFCWLAAGRVHVYLHGRHNLWDYAAGLTILHEAGGYSVTLEGVSRPPMDLEPRSTAAALDASLFRDWCAWLDIQTL